MKNTAYVHGYGEREALRLNDQAGTLNHLIHHDTLFPAGSHILEAGCGVGAQTRIIAAQNPESRFASIDISPESVKQARQMARQCSLTNVEFQQADLFQLPFADETFDRIVVCFVLEHLADPQKALFCLKRVLKTGGILIAIEGDHGSTFFHPDSAEARAAIDCQVRLQRQNGGNSNIGRELHPLLRAAGFEDITVTPRNVYVDASRPEWIEGFTKNTFIAMIEGIREKALAEGIIDAATFDKGIADLRRTTQPDGVFSYTFFKGFGIKPAL